MIWCSNVPATSPKGTRQVKSDNRDSTTVNRATKFAGVALAFLTLTAAHPGAHYAQPMPVAVEQVSSTDAATPVGTVEAFHAALASGNTAAALELLAEDVQIYESGRVEASRAEYASHHLAADAAFSAAVPRTLVSRTEGEDGASAWVMSVETVVGTYRDRAINSRSVETMMLRKVDSEWRIVHIHWSSQDIRADAG